MSSSETAVFLDSCGDVSTNPNSMPEFMPNFGPNFRIEPRLSALAIEHDDLDAAIAALLRHGLYDDLQITRLKKRKLQVKDEIATAMTAA